MIFVENIDKSVLKDKKTCFLSLGCKVNAYETETFKAQFEENGAVTIAFEDGGADIVVINTCSVTNIADRKSRQMLHKARKLNPNAIIVAVGCYVQAVGEKEFEGTDSDIAIGNARKDSVVDIVAEAIYRICASNEDGIKTEGPDIPQETEAPETKINIEKSDTKKTTEETVDGNKPPVPEKETRSGNQEATGNDAFNPCHERTRAFIKVTDGCNQFCTYCIIPYVRGRVRSRGIGDVVEEVARLSGEGYKEVVLTGIHLSSYGVDFSADASNYEKAVADGFNGRPLLELIDEVSKISGIERIRLGSLEPRIITEEFIDRIKNNPKVCPHFHLSLQSGSDSVLKRMKRHYTIGDYENACRIIREAYEQPSINTDIIVGFPGETDDEFLQTVEFAKKIRFAKIHVFKYSRRKGTVADRMPDQVSENIKNVRSAALIEVDNEDHLNYVRSFIGKKLRILTEQEEIVNGEKMMVGLTERYVKVGVRYSKDDANALGENEVGNDKNLSLKTGLGDISQNVFVECDIIGISGEGILIGEVK